MQSLLQIWKKGQCQMKKTLSLLMAICLLLGVLTACASTPATPEEPAAAESSAPASQEAPETAPAEDAAAEPEVEPEATQEVFNEQYPKWLSEDLITFTYWKLWPPFLTGYDPSEASLFSYFKEQLNVAVEVQTISTDAASTQFNLMVASGDYTDLIENAVSNYAGGGTRAIEDEVLIDFVPYLDEYMPDYKAMLVTDEIAMKKMYDAEGQMASVVGLYDEDTRPQQGQWIRKDWLEESGLDMPSTLEDLEKVLDVFKNEYGCENAISVREGGDVPIGNVYGTKDWYVDENGQVQYGRISTHSENYKEYMKKVVEWYDKGYFNSDFLTANDSNKPQSSMLVNGETGYIGADILIISELAVMNTPEGFEVSAVAPITKNADDKLARGWSSKMNDSNQISVTTGCKYPEIACQYINFAFTDDAFMSVNWGTEGVTYEYDENGEPQFTDLIVNNENLAASFAPLAYISPGFPTKKSYSMALASYNHPAQLACYEIFASKLDDSLPNDGYPSNYVSYTSEESEVIAMYSSDIDTYIEESTAKFITGEMDVEADFDEYVSTLKALGIEKLQEVYQAAYDRFMGNN